nr:J497 [uncultured bacterium]
MFDKTQVRNLIEDWAVWREYRPGDMFQGPASELFRARIEGLEQGISILHYLAA